MTVPYFAPAQSWNGGDACIGGIEPYLHLYYTVPLRETKKDAETRAELMEEADERLAAARGQARVDLERHLKAAGVKRKRRGKAEMVAHRAEVASRGQEAVPKWLQETDAEADAEFQRVTQVGE